MQLPSLPAPVAANPPANGVPATLKAYGALLQELLPGKAVPGVHGSLMSASNVMTQVQVEFSVDGGTAEAEVFLDRPGVMPQDAPLCDDVTVPSGRTATCARGTLADGSQVRILHTEAKGTGTSSLKEVEVLLNRVDGVQIEVTIANGLFFGNGSRLAQVPVTDQQAYAIAADPRWGFSMDPVFVQHAETTMTVDGH
ncbi:hypothetical protein GCM10009838_21970 [Catenulispora subtropica]|uniref:Uncharacterized protein n=1 Tax=Catenulispora subtropica TaxID=450798 RepID=A0ABP5CKH0_9ACTN